MRAREQRRWGTRRRRSGGEVEVKAEEKKEEDRIGQDERGRESWRWMRRERRKTKAGRLKQGAAGDAPGGGRRRVRRFAPRLPVTCLSTPRPHPFSSQNSLSFLFPSDSSPPPREAITRHFRFLNTYEYSPPKLVYPFARATSLPPAPRYL